MTHDRPYRRAMPNDQAVGEIRRMAGRQFDPGLSPLFAELAESYESSPTRPVRGSTGSIARGVQSMA
jgi:HD-GYP domain-containing protein (c-di-GMP phosphodiesterase class II)